VSAANNGMKGNEAIARQAGILPRDILPKESIHL
jgi:hypothetical protein